MRYLVSIFVCASLFLSGCITGRSPVNVGVNTQISKSTQKAAAVGTRNGQRAKARMVVSEGSRQIGPAGGGSSETAQWDRF
jgi:hypothetical protein